MSPTAIVWFRRDLRVHDHPPLAGALAEHDRVLPVFVLDHRLLYGRFPSPARAAFLLDSLRELRGALEARGGGLVVRVGDPAAVLLALAREVGAEAVFFASDVSPHARARDRAVRDALTRAGVRTVSTPGNFCADLGRIETQQGGPFTVFSPFHRAWLVAERRAAHVAPAAVPIPGGVDDGELPTLAELDMSPELAAPIAAGEEEARRRLAAFLEGPIDLYAEQHDVLAGGTSVLSPHIHFGNVSVREIEERASARGGAGAEAFRRQLGWRDFYAHVLLHHPGNARQEFQERYRRLEWDEDPGLLDAWREGRTGYPVVDAAMRQLRTMGWMHNRARLVVGSFLTKDLHVDWRVGEAHFMRYLLCGDEASNNGNWQWVASVGVDPAPYFRRMFNPVLQQRKFDPDGTYVRRWVPELCRVPDAKLAEPWTMSSEEQRAAQCVIGQDYPAPVVEHQVERRRAIERYRAASAPGT